MNTRSLLVRLLAATILAVALGTSHVGAQSTFNDATNDIASGIATAGGTLDIVKMEVVDTVTDVIFTMTLNGNTSTGGNDWGNFMIGIANQKTLGTTTGNGWGRPINLNAGVTNGVTNGMTHWIGSWVNGGGGSQLWAYGTTNWSNSGAPAGYLVTPNTNTTIVYTVSKASLGVTNGDTIIFDAYSSGADGNPSAVDALSNPGNAISTWAGPYTSSATNVTPTVGIGQTRSYLLANTALNTTQSVAFSVDMNAQIAIGAFNPAVDSVTVDWGEGFAFFATLGDVNGDGIYTGTATITAPAGTPVAYRFTIELPSPDPLLPETVVRSFTMPTASLTLPTVFFNNIDGFRAVTFTVDMSFEAAASPSRFNPAVDNVTIVGQLNNWDTGSTAYQLSRQGETFLYSGTFQIGGSQGNTIAYKFYTNARPGDQGYEPGNDRILTLGPANQPQVQPPAIFGVTASEFRDITFSVDMSVQVALGLFNPNETDPALGGIVQVRGINGNFDSGPQLTRQGMSLTYSGTFVVGGNGGSDFGYKFWSPGINFYNVPNNTGFEQIVLGNEFANRTVTLSANGVPMNLPTVYFSNQLFYLVGSAPNAFSTTQGSASAAQSVTINGQGLTANILATAPDGFEVSSDGVTYGPTANLVPVSGSVTDSNNLRVRIAASALVGTPAGNVALTSTGSQPVNIAVSGTVTAAVNGYSNWLTNYPGLADTNGTADPDGDGFNNNLEFSFDGNPTVGTPSLMTVKSAGTNAVFNWVQRNSGVGYEVQKNSSLTNAWAEASGLSISNSTNQSGLLLPADYIRREFIVPASGKDFYRVRTTITNN